VRKSLADRSTSRPGSRHDQGGSEITTAFRAAIAALWSAEQVLRDPRGDHAGRRSEVMTDGYGSNNGGGAVSAAKVRVKVTHSGQGQQAARPMFGECAAR
jgi:hypothetical protein